MSGAEAAGVESDGRTAGEEDAEPDSERPDGLDTDAESEVTRRPTTVASGVAAAGALGALVAGGHASATGLAVGLVGALLLAIGLGGGYRAGIDLGCSGLFGCVVLGGLAGAAVEATLLGTVAAVVSWDLAQSALDLGEQLGREARTRRLEAAHAVSSVLVGLSAAVAGYAVYGFAADGQPLAALVLLLVAGVLVTVGLGTRRRRRIDGRKRAGRRR